MDAHALSPLSPAPATLAPQAPPPWPLPPVPALSTSGVMRVMWGIAGLFILSHIIVAAFVAPTITRVDAIPRYVPYALVGFDVTLVLGLVLWRRRKQRKHDALAQATEQAWARVDQLRVVNSSSTISGRSYEQAQIALSAWLKGPDQASAPTLVEVWLPAETVAQLQPGSYVLLRRAPKTKGYAVHRLVFLDGAQLDVSADILR